MSQMTAAGVEAALAIVQRTGMDCAVDHMHVAGHRDCTVASVVAIAAVHTGRWAPMNLVPVLDEHWVGEVSSDNCPIGHPNADQVA